MIKTTTILAFLCFFISIPVFSQVGIQTDYIDQENGKSLINAYNHLNTQLNQKLIGQGVNPVQFREDQQMTKSLNFFEGEFLSLEPDREWAFSNNPDPQLNFPVYSYGLPAGDLNGDGKNSILFSTRTARDERTSDLESTTPKTAIFYGDNRSETPDELYYEYMVPVGDINNNGFDDVIVEKDNYLYEIWYGSATGISPSGQTFNFPTGQQIIGFTDLDGDGYGDIIAYTQGQTSGGSVSFSVMWGGTDLNGQPFTEYNTGVSGDRVSFGIGDIDGNGRDDLIMFASTGEEQKVVKRFQFDGIRNLDDLQTIQDDTIFEGTAWNNGINVMDINGDGKGEVLYYASATSNRYLLSYDETSEVISNTPQLFHNSMLYPLGDLNGNGRIDFVIGDPESEGYGNYPYIAFGPANLSDGVSFDISLDGDPSNNQDWRWYFNHLSGAMYGDLNGNGMDDAVIGHNQLRDGSTAIETRGRRYITGDSGGNIDWDFVHYQSLNFTDRQLNTANVGDVTNNGIEDMAIVHFERGTIDIYSGGSDFNNPTQTIQLPFIPLMVSSGDFNGDGISDLIIEYNAGNQIDIIFGGDNLSTSPDLTINPGDLEEGLTFGYYSTRSIGDINGNGADDFIASSLLRSDEEGNPINELYIFFGGENISSTPDITLSTGNWGGWDSVPLGDINGNGFNDFAVSVLQENNGVGGGLVHIYFGNSSASYSTPDMVLSPNDYTDITTIQFGQSLAAGDFTGDGTTDLAVQAGFSLDGNLVAIFEGGEQFGQNDPILLQVPEETGIGASDFEGLITNVASYGSQIRTVNDVDGTGHSELIMSSHSNLGTNAVGFFGREIVEGNTQSNVLFEAPNQAEQLGGTWGFAVGDFSGTGTQTAMLLQPNDNNDAFRSSRLYSYSLNSPLTITSIEDVPNDQGYWITINAGGVMMDGQSTGFQAFSSWSVWLLGNDGWENKATINYLNNAASKVDVRLPTTLPSDADPTEDSEHVYQLKITAHDGFGGLLAESNVEAGYALDNIAPAKVTGLDASASEGVISLNWNASTAHDLGSYNIYEVNDDGVALTENGPLLTTSSNQVTIENVEDLQFDRFSVSAVDIHRNEGELSEPESAGLGVSNETVAGLPTEFELGQNYPNPFNPTTQIEYALPHQSSVKIEVYNIAGQRVASLVNEIQNAGWHTISFDASSLSSGVYMYRIQTESFTSVKKMLLMK